MSVFALHLGLKHHGVRAQSMPDVLAFASFTRANFYADVSAQGLAIDFVGCFRDLFVPGLDTFLGVNTSHVMSCLHAIRRALSRRGEY